MVRITNKTEPVVTGIIIELSGEDVITFSYLLTSMKDDWKVFGETHKRFSATWPWLDDLIIKLKNARSKEVDNGTK